MRSALRLAFLALAFAAPALPAGACSVAPGYRVPTNLQLAERADTIVLATVVGGQPISDDVDPQGVIVRPTLLLKGNALPGDLRIFGFLRTDPRVVMTRSDPRELSRPNPDALAGACQRYLFERGMILLLFLEKDREGQLNIGGGPFARAAEDVPSVDAPWVRATRLYVEVAALPSQQRRAALIARRDALRSEARDADAALIAADIDRQLASLAERVPGDARNGD